MAGRRGAEALEVVFGAVVGGLIASFVGLAVFNVFMLDTTTPGTPVGAAISGLLCAVLLMFAGVWIADRTPWLGTALLFGAGFTALWSVAISFGVEQRWVTLLVLGAAIVAGIFLGRWRFGRADGAPVVGDGGE